MELQTPGAPIITVSYTPDGDLCPSDTSNTHQQPIMPAPEKPRSSIAPPEGPMTPAADAYDFNIDLPVGNDFANGSYTPGKINSGGGFYPGSGATPDTPQQQRYHALNHDPSTYRRISFPGDPTTLSGVPSGTIRKWTRRLLRRLKAAPFVVKLLLLLGGTVLGVLLIRVIPTLQLPSHRGGVAWSDLQRRLGQGLGGRELCDPYV